MFSFISENLGTIIVGAALLCVTAAIVVKIARDTKKGKCAGCDCGCGECPKNREFRKSE